MCAEAFGELGLHPWEFDQYEFDDFILKRKGYDKMMIDQMRRERLYLSVMMQPYSKKNVRPEDLFLLPGDKGYRPKDAETRKKAAMDLLKKYKEAEAIEKHGGRIKRKTGG